MGLSLPGQGLNHNSPMSVRRVTLTIWLAAVSGAVAWAVPMLRQPTPMPSQAAMGGMPVLAIAGSLERLLGTPAPTAAKAGAALAPQSRFKLLGVIVPLHSGASGLALISVDDKPARAVAVGREVDPGIRVLAVAHRRVELGQSAGAPIIVLELPSLPEASRVRTAGGGDPVQLDQAAQSPLTLHQLKELPMAVETSPTGDATSVVAARHQR